MNFDIMPVIKPTSVNGWIREATMRHPLFARLHFYVASDPDRPRIQSVSNEVKRRRVWINAIVATRSGWTIRPAGSICLSWSESRADSVRRADVDCFNAVINLPNSFRAKVLLGTYALGIYFLPLMQAD